MKKRVGKVLEGNGTDGGLVEVGETAASDTRTDGYVRSVSIRRTLLFWIRRRTCS